MYLCTYIWMSVASAVLCRRRWFRLNNKEALTMRTSLQDLAERIAALQRREHPGRHLADLAGALAWEDMVLGGKLTGAIVELFEAEEGMGAWTLALFMAGQTLHAGKILVVADRERRFYPPAAQRFLG